MCTSQTFPFFFLQILILNGGNLSWQNPTASITDIFPSWWDFVMVGIYQKAIVVIIIIAIISIIVIIIISCKGSLYNGLWPPPSFSENHIADFATKLRQKCVCLLWQDCYNINVLYDPISHEMHLVQQFNMVIGWKTYPEKTLLYHFHAENPFWWCHPSLTHLKITWKEVKMSI